MSNEQTKPKYLYHVAYNFVDHTGVPGFGDTTLTMTSLIVSDTAISKVRDFIRSEYKFQAVVILAFQLLSGPDDER